MPVIPPDQQLALGLTPPPQGEKERDPESKVKKLPNKKRIFRRRLTLSDEKKEKVKKILGQCWDEWTQNTSLLKSKLQKANDLLEGIKGPKDFPWKNSSNLHVPLFEIHITILHSVVAQTMLENDPIFYVKVLTDSVGDSIDTDIESFLHWTCKINLKIDNDLSDIYWNTYRDGLGVGVLDWVEEYDRVYDIQVFKDPDAFMRLFPEPKDAGLSPNEYENILNEIHETEEVPVKIEETIVRYRGPKLRVVEYKDFITIPTTAPSLEYAMFIGDAFLQRADHFRRMVLYEWFDKEETERMLETIGLTQAPDRISQSQDRIEGLSRSRVVKPDEYYCMQGILKINLSDDETTPEKMYLVTYHKETNTLLRIEEFPYIHNRSHYIIWRFKKRSNRLPGQSIFEQIGDINEEVDTQHNQRIDSRTITTVPSFYKLETSDFDPTRLDQRFYPGVTFKVKSTDKPDIKQMPITQTDMGQSLQEEQNLMQLADLRTGASQLRGGSSENRDPRASGKKMQVQLQQSGIRVDDHMRELRISTAELGSQVLELYYQFSPEMVPYQRKDPQTQQFVQMEVARSKLRTRGLFIEVARTSIMDNPSALLQKELTLYEIMMKNPLVAQNIMRIREVSHRLLKAFRERDADKVIPPLDQLMQELQQQQQMNQPNQPATVQNLGATVAQGGKTGPTLNHHKRNGSGPARPAEPMEPMPPA